MATSLGRLLIVDDDAMLREAIVRLIRATCDIVRASNGAEAVARVEAGERFDVILMDLEMPKMNGREAYERIHAIAPELAKRTLIMTGGSAVVELQQWIETLGPGRLLLKPFSRRRLEEAIDELLAG